MNAKRPKKTLARLSTADAALDEILSGGIPTRSVTVVSGQPGSGKTILALQMMFEAARKGQRCLYITAVAEPAVKLLRYMELFDFYDPDLAEKQIVFRDLGAALGEGAVATLAEITSQVEAHEPDFLVIDSFRAVGDVLQLPGGGRAFVYELAAQLAGYDTTTFLVGEYNEDDFRTVPVFGIADGVLQLSTELVELTALRQIQVRKLRGSVFVEGRHFYDIDSRGLRFFPRVKAPWFSGGGIATSERVKTGVAGLDTLLGGGVPALSATVVQGGTGSGKTILSLAFLIEGARQGERGVLFALEETADQLRAVAQAVGWDIAQFEETGLLAIHYTSPVELSTDRFLEKARREIARTGAKRVVFDSLTSMSLGVPSERRFKELVYAIVKHVRAAGATLFMTLESRELLGSNSPDIGVGISFAADNIVQLRYVESEGRLERAISVLKARVIQHSSELRPMVVTAAGIVISDKPFVELRGVLTGRPIARGDGR